MARYMLDTDTCSYIMKRSSQMVLTRLQAVPLTGVCMSVITKSELLYGVEVSPRRAQDATALKAFLPHVEVLEYPDDAAIHCAQIRADLKNRGEMIGANDLFIAAHARSLGLRLVTNNTGEFGRVRGLTVENWTLPRVVLVRQSTSSGRPATQSHVMRQTRIDTPDSGVPRRCRVLQSQPVRRTIAGTRSAASHVTVAWVPECLGEKDVDDSVPASRPKYAMVIVTPAAPCQE